MNKRGREKYNVYYKKSIKNNKNTTRYEGANAF